MLRHNLGPKKASSLGKCLIYKKQPPPPSEDDEICTLVKSRNVLDEQIAVFAKERSDVDDKIYTYLKTVEDLFIKNIPRPNKVYSVSIGDGDQLAFYSSKGKIPRLVVRYVDGVVTPLLTEDKFVRASIASADYLGKLAHEMGLELRRRK